ncbi:MAG: signal peptidase I [Deltaproteobacteria bacterium]|nr:MAG: signal peptidase I [Deltaproteobacteria bacterium]
MSKNTSKKKRQRGTPGTAAGREGHAAARKTHPKARQEAEAGKKRAAEKKGASTGEKVKGFFREVVFLGVLVVAVLSARSSLADHYYVPSGSMLPTVEEGDHLVVNKLAYGFRIPFTTVYAIEWSAPKPGEVVVLESPENGNVLLKRIIAVPGQTVAVRGGRLIIDGAPVPVEGTPPMQLTESLGGIEHPIWLTHDGGGDWPSPDIAHFLRARRGIELDLVPAADGGYAARLRDNQYLVMGDNRGDSADGRGFGPVGREVILGRGIAIYWRTRDGLTWRPLE